MGDGPSALEGLKEGSGYLAGTLAEELGTADPAFSKDASQLLKFHGTYQQDDRDVRRERLKAGLGKDVICMVRASIPGGVLTGEQYLAADRLADEVSAGTLRVTTRQGLQWHFVRKGDLRPLIRTLNDHLVTTLAACGDVVRNVMACPAPLPGRDHDALHRVARELAMAVRPRTSSYWDLWLDGERAITALAPEAVGDLGGAEPLYGPTYLPRKFKIGFAHPGDNCVDIYSHDLGIVPVHDGDHVTGFTLVVGGGLGMSHNNEATYPRLADPLATVATDELIEVATTVIAVQRDHGDRTDRKHARLKYLIDDRGLDWFRGEVQRRLGRTLDAPEPLDWSQTDDHLGWHEQADGRVFLGVPVPAGRIGDSPSVQLRAALREVVAGFGAGVRFTPRQDVLLTDLDPGDRGEVTEALRSAGVRLADDLPLAVRHALACPALPTCGLALTEAERVLPQVSGDIAAELASLGLDGDAVHVRMTGCPNGCARPYSTEVGIVGRGKDHYTVYLGGDAAGTRLNVEFADRVARADISSLLRPVLEAWGAERAAGETFGAWAHRVGVPALRERFPVEAFEHGRRAPVGAGA